MYIMANDAKWVKREEDLDFTLYPGMNLTGLAKDHELKISGMSFDVPGKFYKLRLAWLTDQPMASKEMVELGWENV